MGINKNIDKINELWRQLFEKEKQKRRLDEEMTNLKKEIARLEDENDDLVSMQRRLNKLKK